MTVGTNMSVSKRWGKCEIVAQLRAWMSQNISTLAKMLLSYFLFLKIKIKVDPRKEDRSSISLHHLHIQSSNKQIPSILKHTN